MRKNILLFLSFVLSVCYCGLTFADLVDADTITFIHSKTKTSFFQMCKDKLAGTPDAVCTCLADNTAAKLDDNALKKCDIQDSNCISKVVEAAGLAAFSQEGFKACAQ